MPVDPAALHDEVHLRRACNILQGDSRHGDDIGLPARRNCTEIIALQQFRRDACGLQRARA